MVRLFDDPDVEDRLVAEFDQRRQQHSAWQAQTTPQQVASLAATYNRYPYARPGVTYALSAAAVPTEVADQIAAQSGASEQARGSLNEFDEPVQGSWLTRNLWRPAKTAIRGATTFFQGAYHELVARPAMAAIRSDPDFFGIPNPAYEGETFGAAYDKIGDSPLFRAGDALIAGQRPGLGSEQFLGEGLVPGGQLTADYRAQVEQLKADYGGDVSPGRAVAKMFAVPESSRAYDITSGLVDLAANVFLDPTSVALAGTSKITKANRVFGATPDLFPHARKVLEAASIVGPRKSAVAEDVVDYLRRERGGRRLVGWLRDTDDFDTIWRGMGRKIDRTTALALRDARTDEDVVGVLTDVLGVTIREKPAGAVRRGIRTSRRYNNIRLLADMPGDHIDVHNIDAALVQLDDFMHNAKLPLDVIRRRTAALAEIPDSAPDMVNRVWQVTRDVMGDIETQMGLRKRPLARRLTRIAQDYATEFRSYFDDEIGDPVFFPGAKTRVMRNGEVEVLPTAHLLSEYAYTTLPLPSAREIRRELSNPMVRNILNAVDTVPFLNTDSLDNIMQRVWKPLMLLRGAWVVRVIGEEQVRIGAAGLDSAFRHPLSYVAWAVGSRGATGVTGRSLDDAAEFADAMSRGTMGFLDSPSPGTVRTGRFRHARVGDDDYMYGWHTELGQLWNDPVAQRVAGGLVDGDTASAKLTGLDQVKDWLFNGSGRTFLEQLAESPGKAKYLTDKSVVDAYVDSVWKRIQIKTGGDSELIDAIGTGLLRGDKVRSLEIGDLDDLDWSRRGVSEVLRTKLGVAPDKVKVPDELTVGGRRGRDLKRLDRADKALDTMFSALMSNPTNRLSRSPAFKQKYWEETQRLLPWMDAATQVKVIESASKAGLGAPTIAKMRAVKAGDTITNIGAVDELAKAQALGDVKGLLYDLSRKSQFADITRIVFPFASAWQEFTATWTKLGVQRPQTVRRAQQVSQSGFFHEDESGVDMFNYPGGWFVGKLTGAPDTGGVQLQGRAEGLNLLTQSFVPGFGPAVQIPMTYLLPQKPELAALEELVMPFGRRDLASNVFPAWARRLWTAWQDDPDAAGVYGNLTFDAMRLLYASGDYSPDETARLQDDARSMARRLMLVRGAAQFILPTGPEVEFVTDTASVEMAAFSTLTTEYHDLAKTVGYDEAMQQFLAKHGPQVALLLQPKTKTLKARAQDAGGVDWEQRHPELVRRYDTTIGLFSPPGTQAERDYAAYRRNVETGALAPLTPEQMQRLANNRIASNIYRQAVAAVPNSSQQSRDALRTLRRALVTAYPGFADTFGVPESASVDTRIRELIEASGDEELAAASPFAADAAAGIRVYNRARQAALSALAAQGYTTFKSQAAAPVASALRSLADAVIAAHPGFAGAWDNAFRFELPEDAS